MSHSGVTTIGRHCTGIATDKRKAIRGNKFLRALYSERASLSRKFEYESRTVRVVGYH
jgi:hypothetical protein